MARILVVDDVDVVRLTIGKTLKRAGHAVEEARNGDEAIARVLAWAPDAVVTDLWMPGSDGLALIRVLQQQFPAVALIVMSGGSPRCGPDASLDQGRIAGVAQVLMKPVDRDELLTAIDLGLATLPGSAQSSPSRHVTLPATK
jgi:CheY-like chemotaxis protein